MAKWIRYNANPLGRRTGDCVYRALSVFLDIPWRQAVDDLVRWAADRGLTNFNYRSTYNEYLKEKGYSRHRVPEKGISVEEFIDRFAEQGKTYILSCPRHLTIVKSDNDIDNDDLYLIDTWDCRTKTVDGYWVKDTNPKTQNNENTIRP